MDLHWLRVPQRIQHTILMDRCLNEAAPRYLTELATPVSGTVRRRLQSVSSTDLVVPTTCRSTIGDRTFAVAGLRATSCCPLLCHIKQLQKDLKSHLSGLSFSLWHWQLCILTMYSALVVVYTSYCALQIVRLTLHYNLKWTSTLSSDLAQILTKYKIFIHSLWTYQNLNDITYCLLQSH